MNAMPHWTDLPAPEEPVPAAYRGVWQRTLLETPEGRDTSTWVRWLQTGLWHGDLRVPPDAPRDTPEGLALQQGFGGTTAITRPDAALPEVCTWQRTIDFQPPRSTPDAGHMVFETPARVIETGIHGRYLEVWERLPDSLGRRIALARLDADGQPTAERLLVAGVYCMHLRPRAAAWPADLVPGETLGDLIRRHPKQAKQITQHRKHLCPNRVKPIVPRPFQRLKARMRTPSHGFSRRA